MASPKPFVVAVFMLLCLLDLVAFANAGNISHKLVAYWGQNGVSNTIKNTEHYEKDLKIFCTNYSYDVINLSFLNVFFDKKNKDQLPGLNFASHCTSSVSPEYPSLLRCRDIEAGIKACQQRRKKVLISLGGAIGNYGFGTEAEAKLFAYRVYNLLLGGQKMSTLRPFGRAVLNGVNLDIEQSDETNNQFYTSFVKELRSLEKKDQGEKKSLITASPQCPFPDRYLGPEVGKVLGDVPELIDEVYVQFYNNWCHSANERTFTQRLREWIGFSHNFNGPIVYIGLPADKGAATSVRHYRGAKEVGKIYETMKDVPPFGGFMLWDASFDQNNKMDDGRHYSDYISDILKGKTTPQKTSVPPPPSPTATVSKTTRKIPSVVTQRKSTSKASARKISCHGKRHRLFPHPTSCHKFVHCSHGVPYVKDCPANLHFNPTITVCDWPEIADCRIL